MKTLEIMEDIYLIGDSNITDSRDCAVYLLNLGDLVLIDTGAGFSIDRIIKNILDLGFYPAKISTIILTHCHIDHIGGAAELRKRFGSRLVMHNLDAEIVERGDNKMTAAYWYGIHFKPLLIDIKFDGQKKLFNFNGQEVVCLHTPGHSPGSVSVYLDRGRTRVLFGQDIHGPFLPEFGANMFHWQDSMKKLIALKADILCEGHLGIYKPNEKVTEYIERYLEDYT